MPLNLDFHEMGFASRYEATVWNNVDLFCHYVTQMASEIRQRTWTNDAVVFTRPIDC